MKENLSSLFDSAHSALSQLYSEMKKQNPKEFTREEIDKLHSRNHELNILTQRISADIPYIPKS